MKTDFECIYDWLAANYETFPQLEVIGTVLSDKRNILQPNAAANMYDVTVTPYVDGSRKYRFMPREPYYFDVDIICYRAVYEDDIDRNMRQISKVQSVCDWLIEQQNTQNLPKLEEHSCYMLECLTPMPFLRNMYQEDGDTSKVIVDYAVTVRFYIENPAKDITKVLR